MRETFLPFGRPSYGPEEEAAVGRVLRSGWSGPGPEVEAFERELAAYLQVEHVVCVSSCTIALKMCTTLLGYREWRVPALTWISTMEAAPEPALIDVQAETMCANPQTIVSYPPCIAVAYGGWVPGVSALLDAAHALTPRAAQASYLACYSFYGNKNLAIGEGGAISTNDTVAAAALYRMRNHGFGTTAWQRYAKPTGDPRSGVKMSGVNFKATMSDVQAAIGREQLKKLPRMQERRLEIAQYYVKELKDMEQWAAGMQYGLGTAAHAHHLFVIVLPEGVDRDWVMCEMRQNNIGACFHYRPLSAYVAEPHWALPTTDWLAKRILTLPISASMSLEDGADVVRELKTAIYREQHRMAE